jgi:hypothetical protein
MSRREMRRRARWRRHEGSTTLLDLYTCLYTLRYGRTADNVSHSTPVPSAKRSYRSRLSLLSLRTVVQYGNSTAAVSRLRTVSLSVSFVIGFYPGVRHNIKHTRSTYVCTCYVVGRGGRTFRRAGGSRQGRGGRAGHGAGFPRWLLVAQSAAPPPPPPKQCAVSASSTAVLHAIALRSAVAILGTLLSLRPHPRVRLPAHLQGRERLEHLGEDDRRGSSV